MRRTSRWEGIGLSCLIRPKCPCCAGPLRSLSRKATHCCLQSGYALAPLGVHRPYLQASGHEREGAPLHDVPDQAMLKRWSPAERQRQREQLQVRTAAEEEQASAQQAVLDQQVLSQPGHKPSIALRMPHIEA